jgi:hypothetical protein
MARKATPSIGFTRNLILYYAAIGVIILGYVFLSIGGANSFTSLTLGPVVLVAGYLVAMPVALLMGARPAAKDEETIESSAPKMKTAKKS